MSGPIYISSGDDTDSETEDEDEVLPPAKKVKGGRSQRRL
jgi:hypothetical protein